MTTLRSGIVHVGIVPWCPLTLGKARFFCQPTGVRTVLSSPAPSVIERSHFPFLLEPYVTRTLLVHETITLRSRWRGLYFGLNRPYSGSDEKDPRTFEIISSIRAPMVVSTYISMTQSLSFFSDLAAFSMLPQHFRCTAFPTASNP